MTNQQLAILIDGYRREIAREIEALEEVVPSETRKDMLGHEYKIYPTLGGLRKIYHNMDAAIELLGREE